MAHPSGLDGTTGASGASSRSSVVGADGGWAARAASDRLLAARVARSEGGGGVCWKMISSTERRVERRAREFLLMPPSG